MRIVTLVLLLSLTLAGCLSFSSSSPPRQTIVVPPSTNTTVLAPGTTIVCTNGMQPPC
jgi:hypothetical protein